MAKKTTAKRCLHSTFLSKKANNAAPPKRSPRIAAKLRESQNSKLETATKFQNGEEEIATSEVSPKKQSKIAQEHDVKPKKQIHSRLHIDPPESTKNGFKSLRKTGKQKPTTFGSPKRSTRILMKREKDEEQSQVKVKSPIISPYNTRKRASGNSKLAIGNDALKMLVPKETETHSHNALTIEDKKKAAQYVAIKARVGRRNDRSISIGEVPPVIRKRVTHIRKDMSDIRLATKLLHVSEVPKALTCREKEFMGIYQIIKNKILDKSGGCMYVGGYPGTGKTATIAEVMRVLQTESVDEILPKFEFIQMNAMQLTEPQQAYVHMYHHFAGVKIRWNKAHSLLQKLFSIKAEAPTILIADEFEMLRNTGHRVIYNLLDWAIKPTAQFFFVAVGNVIDPEQISGSVASRLGATRFTFQPYTQIQLKSIVQARLVGVNIFENDALELVARKVASISGDCRRTLDICRRAAEIAEKDCVGQKILVSMSHIVRAFDEMISNPKAIAIKGCSKYEKIFLQAVAAELARTGADETVFFDVYKQFQTICGLNGMTTISAGVALRISSRLGSSRILICEHANTSIHQRIMLNVTEDEFRYALDSNIH